MSQFPVPLINGNRFGFSSVDFRPLGFRITDIKDIEYSTTLTPGKVYGTSAFPVGRTRGQQECDGSISFYREAWHLFADALALLTTTSGLSPFGAPAGIQEVSWDATISYAEAPTTTVYTDVLKGCRIKKISNSAAEGSEALVVKVELDIMQTFIGLRVGQALPLNIVVI